MRFGQGQYAERRYAEEVRTTPEEVLDVLPWESRDFGEEPIVIIDGTAVSIPADRTHPYRLEIHDGAGLWLANLREWWGGQHSQEANIGDELTFTIAYDNTYAALLVYPNQVWLRDMYGAVIEQFEMARTEPEQSGDSRYLHVICRDKLSRLATEVVTSYEVTAADSLTVLDVVSALLGLQQRDDPIAIGAIDPAIGSQSALLSAHNTTVLGALRQMQAALSKDTAGIMYTDAAGAFNWRVRTGWQVGQVIAIGGNMTGVRVTKNFDNLVNRLYMYGHGQDEDNRLFL